MFDLMELLRIYRESEFMNPVLGYESLMTVLVHTNSSFYWIYFGNFIMLESSKGTTTVSNNRLSTLLRVFNPTFIHLVVAFKYINSWHIKVMCITALDIFGAIRFVNNWPFPVITHVLHYLHFSQNQCSKSVDLFSGKYIQWWQAFLYPRASHSICN